MKRLLLIFCSVSVFIGTVKAQDTPAEISKKFFEIYTSKPNDAIDYLFSGTKLNKQVSEDINAIKKNLKVTIDQDGSYYGYELIGEKNVGNTLQLMSYMAKYDKQPVRFIFIYYKPNDKWKIYTFQFNTNMDEELTSALSLGQSRDSKP